LKLKTVAVSVAYRHSGKYPEKPELLKVSVGNCIMLILVTFLNQEFDLAFNLKEKLSKIVSDLF